LNKQYLTDWTMPAAFYPIAFRTGCKKGDLFAFTIAGVQTRNSGQPCVFATFGTVKFFKKSVFTRFATCGKTRK